MVFGVRWEIFQMWIGWEIDGNQIGNLSEYRDRSDSKPLIFQRFLPSSNLPHPYLFLVICYKNSYRIDILTKIMKIVVAIMTRLCQYTITARAVRQQLTSRAIESGESQDSIEGQYTDNIIFESESLEQEIFSLYLYPLISTTLPLPGIGYTVYNRSHDKNRTTWCAERT